MKSILFHMIVFAAAGAAMVFSMRVAEIVWPEPAAKLLICLADDIGTVEQCKVFTVEDKNWAAKDE